MADQFWGHYRERNAGKSVGPFASREEAIAAAMAAAPLAKGVSSSRGTIGGFDIRFHDRSYEEIQEAKKAKRIARGSLTQSR